MLLRFFVITLFIFSSQLWALPQNIEIWFVSPPKYVQLLEQLKIKHPKNNKQLYWAYNENLHKQCQKSGELFFHPQIGLHDHLGDVPGVMVQPVLTQDEVDKLEYEDNKTEGNVKYLSNMDVDLVSCDSNYYFDLFCGKSKGKTYLEKNNGFEVWIDTSSSLNQVDRKDKNGDCFRKSFIKRLRSHCQDEKLQVSVFDTSLKAMGSEDSLCDNIGLNDQDRLIQWIKNSKAKRLLVVTDIYELSMKISDFIETVGATSKGDIPQKEIVGADLLRYAGEYQKYCK